jgi:hypothetical protein
MKAKDKEILMQTLKWFDVVPYQNTLLDPYNSNEKESLYFRLIPMYQDWVILILMGILSEVNQAFTNRERADKLIYLSYSLLSDDHKTFSYYFNRVKYLVKSVFLYCVLGVMIYLQHNVQTNIINWTFFVANVINLSMMITGDHTPQSYKRNRRVASFIKFYSISILLMDIAFIFFIGEKPKTNKPESLDQKFSRTYPELYKNLDIIGFRSNDFSDLNELKNKFFAYAF